jgi:heptosyltransferase-2
VRNGWLARWLDAATCLPYPEVNQGWGRPLTLSERLRALKRYLHKRLVLAWTGQSSLMRQQAATGSRVLVAYFGADNIGDALMDMAGRRLIKGSGWQVDLLVDPRLAPLFAQDDVFARVFSDPAEVDPDAYGFVLLNNLNLRTLRRKRELLPRVPFCSMVGFFYAIDFNHIELSAFSFNEVFGLGAPAEHLLAVAQPYLPAGDALLLAALDALPSPSQVKPTVLVAVGGREVYRTYHHWPALFHLLDRADAPWAGWRFVLIGSDNGKADAEAVGRLRFEFIEVESRVGQTDLFECRALMARSQVFIGADGGLMHLAHTTGIATLTLFSAEVRPCMRLTPACGSTPMHSAGDVSAIAPEEIARVLATWVATHPLEVQSPATPESVRAH